MNNTTPIPGHSGEYCASYRPGNADIGIREPVVSIIGQLSLKKRPATEEELQAVELNTLLYDDLNK